MGLVRELARRMWRLGRQISLQLMLLGVLALCAGEVAVAVGASASEPAVEPLKVVLLPTRVAVFERGLVKVESSAEWTAAAAAAVEQSVQAAVHSSTKLNLVEMPPLTPEEAATVGAFQSMRLLERMCAHEIDQTIGPELAFLAERTGADFALGVIAWQTEQSDQSAAAGWLGAAASFVVPGLILLPTVSGNQAHAFLVDMRTGTVRWMSGRSGYELGGYNFTDLRDPQSAAEVVADLLGALPEVTTLQNSPISQSPAVEGLATRPVAPKQMLFSFRPPEGWSLRPLRRTSVELSRYAGELDSITVALRSNRKAFPRSGQVATPESTPDDLLKKFIAELESEERPDLQILETAVDAEFGGHAAFSVRFSQRMQAPFEDLRLEHMAIGTAVPRGFLLAQLSAPELNYFPEARPVFEESMRSLLMVSPANYPRER